MVHEAPTPNHFDWLVHGMVRFLAICHTYHTPSTHFSMMKSQQKMINNFSTFNNCLLHTSYDTIEPIKNICGLWGGMLWSIYSTVNSVESVEFTGAVKYLK